MNNSGQRIFKIIVWILLGIMCILSVYKFINNLNHPKLTEKDWINFISEKFSINDPSYIDPGSLYNATEKYAAITAMKAIGEDYIMNSTMHDESGGNRSDSAQNAVGQGISGKGSGGLDDETLIALAIEKNIVSEKDLDKPITEERAREIMSSIMDYCFDTDNYPEYFDIKYTNEVVDISNWQSMEFEPEENIILVSDIDNVPEPGQLILPRDEFGIAKPRRITSCEETENGYYELRLEAVENPSELYEDISFSGGADFSYLLGTNDQIHYKFIEDGQSTGQFPESQNNILGRMSFIDCFMPITSYAVQFSKESSEDGEDKTSNDNTNTVDLEVGGELKLNPNDKLFDYNSTLSVKDDGVETVYEVKIDNEGNVELEASLNTDKYEFEIEIDSDYDDSGKKQLNNKKSGKDVKDDKDEEYKAINEKDKHDTKTDKEKTKKHKLEGESSCTIKYDLKLDNLAIVAAYNPSIFESKRSVDLKIISDVEFNVGIEGEYSGDVLIAEVPVPISGTGGLVSVRLKLYFHVGLDGEISLVCKMEDAYIGVNISKSGITIPHDKKAEGSYSYLKASVTLEMGLLGEVDVVVGDWLGLPECILADPALDIKFVGEAENLPQNEGFENYEKCIQFNGYLPVIDFRVSSSGDSAVNELIDIFDLPVKDSYEILNKEQAPLKLKKHIETELDGTINILNGGEEVCTHFKKVEETIESVPETHTELPTFYKNAKNYWDIYNTKIAKSDSNADGSAGNAADIDDLSINELPDTLVDKLTDRIIEVICNKIMLACSEFLLGCTQCMLSCS